MKIYYFTEEINKESVEKFTKFIESEEGELLIYFETLGGNNSFTEFMKISSKILSVGGI